MDSDFRPRPRPLRQPVGRQHASAAQNRTQLSHALRANLDGNRPVGATHEHVQLAPTTKPASTVGSVPRSKSKRAIWSIAAVLFIGVALFAADEVITQQNSPVHTATAFVQDLERGDTTGAQALGINHFQVPHAASAITGGNIMSTKQNSHAEQTSSKQGIITYAIQTKNGTKYVRVELIDQVGGTWRVINLVVSDQPQNTVLTT